MALPHAGFIFTKCQVKDPMHAVFNTPVTSYRVGEGFHLGETEQKIAGFLRDLLLDASFRSNHPNPSQVLPSLLGIKILQNRWITDGPVLSDFQTPMRFFDRAIRLTRHGGKRLLLRHGKRRLHLIVEIAMVLASAP